VKKRFTTAAVKGLGVPEASIKVSGVSAGRSAVVATVVGAKDLKSASAVATKAKDPGALAAAIDETGLGECEISEPVVTDAKQALKDEQAKKAANAAAAKQAAKETAAAVKQAEKAAKDAIKLADKKEKEATKLAAKTAKEAAKLAEKEAKKKKGEEAAAAKLAEKEAKTHPFTVAFNVTLSEFTVSSLFFLETRMLASDCVILLCPVTLLFSFQVENMDTDAQKKFISATANGLDIPVTRVRVGGVSAGSAVVATVACAKDTTGASVLASKAKDPAALAAAIDKPDLASARSPSRS